MFSEAVLDHFRNPRNAGELRDATAAVEVTNPVCGDVLRLFARFESGRIAEGRRCVLHPVPPAERWVSLRKQAGNADDALMDRLHGKDMHYPDAPDVPEELRGRTPAEARGITAEFLSLALGGLPPATFHGAQLAAEAVAALLPQLPSSAG